MPKPSSNNCTWRNSSRLDAVQRDVLRLLAVIGHGAVGGEQPAQNRRLARPVEPEDPVGKRLAHRAGIEHGVLVQLFDDPRPTLVPTRSAVAVSVISRRTQRAAVLELPATAWSPRCILAGDGPRSASSLPSVMNRKSSSRPRLTHPSPTAAPSNSPKPCGNEIVAETRAAPTAARRRRSTPPPARRRD